MNDATAIPAPLAMSRRDYLFVALIMGLMGAFFWAIRGTGGFGGEQGGILAGVGWAILWHGFSRLDGAGRQRPYGHAAVIAAITFGVAIGGFTGYGVYNSWVRGLFYLDHPNGLRDVGAWTGYAMLFLCGLHWGGIPGAFLAWCAPRTRLGGLGWLVRIASGAGGAVAAYVIVDNFPQWFLPFYSEGLYQVEANKTCIRALDSIHTIAPHVGLFLGFLAFEMARRDWRAVGVMLVMSLGFAIPFAVGGYWHTLNDSALQISWWKNWEMSIGLGGGLAFGLAFYLFNRPDFSLPPNTATLGGLAAGAGIPMALAVVQILTGGYEGFRRLHELPWPELPDFSEILVLGGIALTAAAFLLWARWQNAPDNPEPGPAIPWWLLMEPIDLIVIVGFLISVPKELELANTVLLVLYTVYIALSAILFAFLLHRPLSSAPLHATKGARVKSALTLALLLGAAAAHAADSAIPRVFVWDAEHLAKARAAVTAQDADYMPAMTRLLKDADEALQQGPFSVMDKKAVPPSGDKHDYMSVGPYWWPNPDTKDGLPYVRRDGVVNPERELYDNVGLGRMCSAVQPLALAFFFTADEKFAAHAARLLRVWFLDPATRMNPNLEYGQAIPGRVTGRGTGIIDTACLINLVDAVGLLEPSAAWTKSDQRKLRRWFTRYADWLRSSKHGRDEARAKNNHGTWYDAQLAAFSLFTGKTNDAKSVLARSARQRIAYQIQPDGSQPLELERTNSFNYSAMNLRGFFTLATLAEHVDVDLWTYQTKDGRSIRKALDFLLENATGDTPWPYEQIKPAELDRLQPLLLTAAIHLDPQYKSPLQRIAPKDRANLLFPTPR